MGKLRVSGIYRSTSKGPQKMPLFAANVAAGFPSPADDYMEGKLDLNELLIQHPAATFFVRVDGDSMTDAGINSGDLLVVDRALEPENNRIVIAVLNGELTVKRVLKKDNRLFLKAENKTFSNIEITDDNDFEVWGVVTHVIHHV